MHSAAENGLNRTKEATGPEGLCLPRIVAVVVLGAGALLSRDDTLPPNGQTWLRRRCKSEGVQWAVGNWGLARVQGGELAHRLHPSAAYVCMNILNRALGGNYCNFGAMLHYKVSHQCPPMAQAQGTPRIIASNYVARNILFKCFQDCQMLTHCHFGPFWALRILFCQQAPVSHALMGKSHLAS